MAYQPGLQEGTDITGAALPAGGASGRGWLSAIWKALTDRLPAALTGSGNLKVAVVESTASQAVTQSGTWTVQPGNTANTTAWKVDNSGVTQPISAASLPLPTGAAQEHTAAATPHSVRLTDGTSFYKGTTPADTQPVSGTVTANQGGTWTVQPGNTANTTAWKVDNSGVVQPVSGTVAVSNLAADQLVHATNLDIATSALRDAITAAGGAAKTLADVVTAISQMQAAAGASLPATVNAIAGYDQDQKMLRPLPVSLIAGTPRVTVDDPRGRQELLQLRLALQELITLVRERD